MNPFDKTVIYRGVKIPPIPGKRSKIARAIRDELMRQAEDNGCCGTGGYKSLKQRKIIVGPKHVWPYR